jgi:hypothetical protein
VTIAPAYPRAERLDLVDHLHGRAVADPYRWLEDPDGPRTREWSAAQDALARAHLDALPGRDRLATTLAALAEAAGSGRRSGGRGAASPPAASRGRNTVSCTSPSPTVSGGCCSTPSRSTRPG